MLICKQCNTQFEDGLTHCTSCGAPLEAPAEQTVSQQDISAKLTELNNTADTTSDYSPEDIESNKIMAVLAYIIFLIPLLAAKDSPFAKFHTNQGFVLFLAAILSSVVSAIPIIGWILAPVAALAVTIFAIIGIINALGGKAKELPVIGKFKILK